MKRVIILTAVAIITFIVFSGCNNSKPKYETRMWFDYFGTDEMPWNESKELTLTNDGKSEFCATLSYVWFRHH